MRSKVQNNLSKKLTTAGQAVVIGGGMAGLTAARVLAQHDYQVTVIDRDRLPDGPAFRAGIPQAQHAHTLLPYGQMLLEGLFPGLVSELLSAGAWMVDADHDTAYYAQGGWRKPEPRSSRPVVSLSRPLLEDVLRRRVTALPNVRILPGVEATGLMVDDLCAGVAGVTVHHRGEAGDASEVIPAGLVVDASGRNSKTPQWLAELGCTPPEEWQIDAHAGYASRIYRKPDGFLESWKKLYVGPSPPDGRRGGVIVPLEGDRWHVTLIGLAGDYPPTDEQGFMDFARSLPTKALYRAIANAEPLSRISGFRKSANRVRRFDHLPRTLEGLLVLGDAAYTMNPIYSLGMTAAAVACQVLDQLLSEREAGPGREGLSAAFQAGLAKRIAGLWQQAVQGDWRWPSTEINDNTEALYAMYA